MPDHIDSAVDRAIVGRGSGLDLRRRVASQWRVAEAVEQPLLEMDRKRQAAVARRAQTLPLDNAI